MTTPATAAGPQHQSRAVSPVREILLAEIRLASYNCLCYITYDVRVSVGDCDRLVIQFAIGYGSGFSCCFSFFQIDRFTEWNLSQTEFYSTVLITLAFFLSLEVECVSSDDNFSILFVFSSFSAQTGSIPQISDTMKQFRILSYPTNQPRYH